MGERRDTKKRETRQRISDVATAMFFERGYEQVTVDEIAQAANVSKMTVFNYFSRKEELMLDREEDLLLLPFRDAIRDRAKGESVVAALRVLVGRLNDHGNPITRIDALTVDWWRVVAASPALRARLHELADEATELLATALGGHKPEGSARLAAGLIVLTLNTARAEALRVLERGASAKKANAAFLALVDRGLTALDALLEGR